MAEQKSTTTGADGLTDTERMIQDALKQAETSLGQIQTNVEAQPAPIPQLTPAKDAHAAATGIELLGDVDLNVTIELGRTEMLVEDVLHLSDGSIVELDKLAGDPVDVYVNKRLIARGEVLVLNDNFCIRISEIVSDLEDQVQEAVNEVAQSK